MPETEAATSPPPAPRRRFRRVLRWLGWTLLVVVVFHRPLFHTALRLGLRLAAARMQVDLDLRTSGTIFTNFTVEGVRARPTGSGKPTPIAAIDIREVRLHYSLPRLLQHGVGEFLDSYEIHHANLEFLATPSATRQETREKVRIAQLLNNILGQPAAYADRVWIENFNITVTAPENVTEVKAVHFKLDPVREGYLQIGRLAAPGIPVWENLSATTAYRQRNLFIRGLQLAPELIIDELNFDASRRARREGTMRLQARAFGGRVSLELSGRELAQQGENLPNSYNTQLAVEIAGVAIDRAAVYFGAPPPPVSRLAQLAIRFTGEPEKPRTWRGTLSAGVEAIAAGPVKIDTVGLAANFNDGTAEITAGQVAAGKNRVSFGARVALPESVNDFPKSDVDAAIKIDAPDLPVLTAAMPRPLGGAIAGSGSVVLRAGQLRAELTLDAQQVASEDLAVRAAKVAVQAIRQLDPPPPSALDGLDARVSLDVREVRFKTFALDSARLEGEARNRLINLGLLEVHRGENYVSARGTARVPEDPRRIAQTPVEAQFALHVPNLAAFGIAIGGQTLQGALEGEGNVKYANGTPTGTVKLGGSAFRLGGFAAQQLAAQLDFAKGDAVLERLALQIDGHNQIVATGRSTIAAPFTYEAGLLVELKSLASFQPLLAVFGQTQPLAGAVALEWNGKGTVDPQAHRGELRLAADKVKFGAVDVSEVRLGGLYTPEFAESQPFRIVAGTTSLGGVIEFRESRLRLKDLKFEQAGTEVLTGYLFLPFEPENRAQPIPLEKRIAANINTTRLDLEKLLASFGQSSPVSGTFTANFVTSGTLLQPLAHLRLEAQGLQAKAARQFEPGSLALDVHYSNKELAVDATVKQPQIQPLTLKGRAPFDLERLVQEKKLDPALPLEATARLPASSLAFVPKLAPQVRRIEGTAALDVRVAGTVGKPQFSGTVDVALKGARMVDENIPAIGAFNARLGFAEDKLTFQRFEGEVGGGTFKLGGHVGLADLKNPVFALRLESDQVLVKRDDSITIRADTDVKLDGPLNAAAVSGDLFIVNSRFFREIDILPIALPGRPKPAPKVASTGPAVISIPQAPLRDWKFDLGIKTREKDPFLIRGNLANGAVSLDLRLGGTGLNPYLEGTAKIEQFVATLPFSKLSITSGFAAFTKDQPFQPSIELQAESRVREYNVRAFIYGKATEPQVQLNSEPPLPHSDIVSLLATGTTTSELAGNADALASRAAMLAVKQLYQKIFKRGAAPPPEEKADSGSLMDRFEVELGALNNQRSGGQDVKARVRITDQVYLLGDLSVDGFFTGSLKYLIRFR